MDKLKMKTTDVVDENIRQIGELFPNCLTERMGADGKPEMAIDFDQLRQELSRDIVEGPEERYQFTWPDKRNAIRLANTPTTDTLRPCRDDSVDFDNTQNLYIEGDNLEVLKLLRENYLGKVKMIYIDPPYNTGKDFVYKDDFAQDTDEYIHNSGQEDDDGNRLVPNPETNGRFHTDWLNMMYPRLKVAKDLLSNDGVLFVSIDDHEVENLRKICDDIFGEWNRLDRGMLIWANRGSSKGFHRIVKNHEYILAYAKQIERSFSCYGENFPDELDELEHYCFNKPSPKNPYNDVKFEKGCKIEGVQDITFKGRVGSDVKLEIIGNDMVFKDGILQNDVVLRGTFPYVNQINDFFKNQKNGLDTFDTKGQKWVEIYFNSAGMPRYRKERNNEIISSIVDEKNIPNYGSSDIAELFGNKEIFSFPKPKELIMHIEKYFLPKNSIVMDFFSGSATTAHAMMLLNAASATLGRKYIMVQIPEDFDETIKTADSNTKKQLQESIKYLDSISKPHLITEIGKERIRRAGKKIEDDMQKEIEEKQNEIAELIKKMAEKNKQKTFDLLQNDDEDATKLASLKSDLKLKQNRLENLDIGFRVLKLDSSNMEDVYYTPEAFSQKTLFELNIKPGRTDEDLLFQAMIELGIELSAKIERETISDKTVWNVADGRLLACFDKEVSEDVITAIAKQKPYYFVMCDASLLDDHVADNFEQIFEHYSKDTIRKII